jgi:aryl-alcohol dehydrogenase-like predicted oxidoreductase
MTGATRVEQIEENAKSGDWRLTPEEMRQVDEILEGVPTT